MIVVAPLAIFVTASLLVYAAALKAEERMSVRAARARLADYDAPALKREEDLKASFSERVIRPMGGFVVGVVRRFLPGHYAEKVRHKLVLAGRGQPEDIDRFLVARVLSIVSIPVLWLVVWKMTSLKGVTLLAAIILVGVAGALGPDAWLNRAVEERRVAIRRKLPDILDLLTISVEAGLGFEQAMARTVTMVPGPLSEEFSRTLGEMRAGSSRADALAAMDARTEVAELRSFVLALMQADTFGVSVGSILRSQAAEMRVRRHQFAQEQAQKAPVKMLFPMVFCIMPALFVIIAGPAVLSIFHAFRGH
jgi:tight adherence protein C